MQKRKRRNNEKVPALRVVTHKIIQLCTFVAIFVTNNHRNTFQLAMLLKVINIHELEVNYLCCCYCRRRKNAVKLIDI